MSASRKGLKDLPPLNSDAEADLGEYDLSGFTPTRFEFEEKTAQVNMRMSRNLLDAIKQRAKARGIPYQRYIRETLEDALRKDGE